MPMDREIKSGLIGILIGAILVSLVGIIYNIILYLQFN